MTRIVSGAAGSLVLTVPKSGTRPTSERVREAVFSALESANAIDGAQVLDLYAGSGALGLEALSRGARSVTLVEKAPPAVAACRTNIAAIRRVLPTRDASIVARSVSAFLATCTGPVDLVLVDPPYDLADEQLAAELALVQRILSANGVVVVERSRRSEEPMWPDGLVRDRERRYGETTIWWASHADHSRMPSQPA